VNPLPTLAACALAGSLAGVPSWAQPAASPTPAPAPASGAAAAPVSLRAALGAAWQRAIVAREADGQRRRADADRLATSRLWASAPTLELGHRDDRLHSHAGQRETEIGIAMPLWLPGQRAARAGSADAAIAQAVSAEQVARLRVAGEVREAAWQLASLQAEARQAEAQATALRQVADDVDRRVRAGDLARADSLAAQAEFLGASAALADASQRQRSAQARWTLLTGLTALPDLPGASEPDAFAVEVAVEVAVDVAVHPERVLASQSVELARKRLELVRHSRRDPPELTVGVRQDMPGRGEASQGSLALGLRLPFGTDDRNRPLEAAALSELDIAQALE
jgi:outer membrane protein, heavy metal efflux system